jgi:hypothetical protein
MKLMLAVMVAAWPARQTESPVYSVRSCRTVDACLGFSREPDPVVGAAIAREYFGDSREYTGAAPNCLRVFINVRSA